MTADVNPNPYASESLPPPKTKRSWLFEIVIPLAILASGLSVVAALGSVEPKGREQDDDSIAGRLRRLPAAQVQRVMTLQEVDRPLELRVDGVVVPYREITIAAEVAGRIIKKTPECETGNFVKKGTLLIEIDPTDYEQEVERLTRARAQDYQALKEVDQELSNTKMLVETADQDLVLQEREVKRLMAMPAGFASEGELDRAKKAQLTASQTKIGYENQLRTLAARRVRLEAAEQMATTQLHTAEINLKRTKIFSPVDGVIVEEHAELNSFVQRGNPIAMLDDVSKSEVAVKLRMDQLHWVLDQRPRNVDTSDATASNVQTQSVGYTLPETPAIIEYEVAGRNGTQLRWNGRLTRYDGIGLDPLSRTVPVVIVVDEPRKFAIDQSQNAPSVTPTEATAASPSPLVRGMFVSVRLHIRPQTPLIAIPAIAIQPGNRVWEFLPDDAVLAKTGKQPAAAPESNRLVSTVTKSSSEETTSTSPPDTHSPSSETGTAPKITKSSDEEFDPNQWQAGRVVIRKNIVPVDSLWLTDEPVKTSGSSAAQRRFWICEAMDGALKGGSWVVDSPLGDFEAELPARVRKESL